VKSRLAHTSYEAMARRMQMSRDRLFLFVEGRELDVPFFDGLAQYALGSTDATFAVMRIETVHSGGPGGKPGLLDFYTWLRYRRKLKQSNSHGSTSAVFCMDSDLDGPLGRSIRSRHVIYTCLYNVEAEIFVHADHEVALSAALSLTAGEAAALAKKLGHWPHDLAKCWSSWSRLCLLSVALASPCDVSPKRVSAVNLDTYGQEDPGRIVQSEQLVLAAARCVDPTAAELQATRAWKRACRDSDKMLALVNGKHFAGYLNHRVRLELGNPAFLRGFSGAASRVWLTRLDFSAPWSDYYRVRLRRVCA
jgi:hypothetical protein